MNTKLIIFGITGDLSRRKLLPALDHIVGRGEQLTVIGVSRREVDVSELLTSSVGHDKFADSVSIVTMDLSNPEDYVRLKEHTDLQADEQLLIYLSVPPSAAADIVDLLGAAGLDGTNVKLMLEKPFGVTLESAEEYLTRMAKHFEEAQIYRIDHYAAKEIAQEIVKVRREGEVWNKDDIVSVDIVASEAISIEGRATFYEEVGALRDIVQGHLMQILALVLMPLGQEFDSEKVPEYRLRALQRLIPANPTETTRAQYEGYRQDAENPFSRTETFVSVLLESDDITWQNVPLRLTTGKSLDAKRTYVKLTHKDGSETILDEAKLDSPFSDAYERVLVEAIEGHKAIFSTAPEIIRAWQIVDPLQAAWAADTAPLKEYAAGSSIDSILQG